MTKLASPLLSFGATGTLANSVTFARRRKVNIAEKKPVPFDRQSLAQIYQRWNYQDYAALWHTLSASEKLAWESNARPYHMTGFAYWMRSRLTTLPDIVSRWHLDRFESPTAPDSSRNENHGTIYGANYFTGHIASALSFDGIDDYVLIPSPVAELPIGAADRSIEVWANVTSYADHRYLFWYGQKVASLAVGLYCLAGTGRIGFTDYLAALGSTTPLPIGEWHLVTFTLSSGDQAKLYLDETLIASGVLAAPLNTPSTSIVLGARTTPPEKPFYGGLDHITLCDRVLSPTDIKRHSERRYPL